MQVYELSGRPPAVNPATQGSVNDTCTDHYVQPLFGHGKLRGVCVHDQITISAPLRDGVYTELLTLKPVHNSADVVQFDIIPSTVTCLQQWEYSMQDTDMRIDCADALDFYCIVPGALLAEAWPHVD